MGSVDIIWNKISTGEFQAGLSFGTLQGTSFVTGLKEKNIAGAGREIDFTINTATNNTIYEFGLVEPYVFNKDINYIYYRIWERYKV